MVQRKMTAVNYSRRWSETQERILLTIMKMWK